MENFFEEPDYFIKILIYFNTGINRQWIKTLEEKIDLPEIVKQRIVDEGSSWLEDRSIVLRESILRRWENYIPGTLFRKLIEYEEESEPFDFFLSVTPTSKTISKYSSAIYNIKVTLLSGEPENVWLTVTGLSPGLRKSFRIDYGIPTFETELELSTGLTTLRRTHTITIRAFNLNETIVKTVTITLKVT